MYPRISDIINDIFGTNILLPIQSFGFFAALGFIAGLLAVRSELNRRQQAGVFPLRSVKVRKQGPTPISEVVLNTVLMLILGYKLGLMFVDYTAFAQNPQAAILSGQGSVMWALIFGVVTLGINLWWYNKTKNEKEVFETEQHGPVEDVGTLFTLAFVFGIIGSKIFYHIEYWEEFIADPIGGILSFDGLTFYGGLLTAALVILFYARSKGYPLLNFIDSTGPTLIAGYSIGRMGCHTAGDGDWGIVNTSPKPDWLSWLPDHFWAFDYPHNVLNRGVPIEGCTGEFCHHLPEPVFPTPLYEVIMGLSIFAFLWFMRKRFSFLAQAFATYMMLNGIERFLIEKIRVNDRYGLFGIDSFQVTQAEVISTGIFLTGLTLFIFATFVWKKPAVENTLSPLAKKNQSQTSNSPKEDTTDSKSTGK